MVALLLPVSSHPPRTRHWASGSGDRDSGGCEGANTATWLQCKRGCLSSAPCGSEPPCVFPFQVALP